MSIDLMEHKALLGILRNIEEKISKLQNPFKEDLLAYKNYMLLVEKTVILLNKTIGGQDTSFQEDDYKNLLRQIELLEMISEANLN